MTFYYEEDDLDIDFVPYEGGPCPVCGADGGNCVGESSSHNTVTFIPPKKHDDPFATFTVPERLYEEWEQNGRVYRKLLYPQGARIRPEEARKLGLIP